MNLKIKFAGIASLLIATALAAQTTGRLLTRAEIAAAIQKSIDANGFSAGTPLQPSDISLDSHVLVTESHPVLIVTRMESRPGAASTNAALWTSSEPHTPPFWVTIDRPISESAPNETAARSAPGESHLQLPATPPLQTPIHYVARASTEARPVAHMPSNDRPLVHVGNPIELIVQGAGMRITAKAKALETGRKGQQIRVQCEPAGKILVARIVSAEAAEIDY